MEAGPLGGEGSVAVEQPPPALAGDDRAEAEIGVDVGAGLLRGRAGCGDPLVDCGHSLPSYVKTSARISHAPGVVCHPEENNCRADTPVCSGYLLVRIRWSAAALGGAAPRRAAALH